MSEKMWMGSIVSPWTDLPPQRVKLLLCLDGEDECVMGEWLGNMFIVDGRDGHPRVVKWMLAPTP